MIGVVGLAIAALTFAALVARGDYVGELSMTAGQWGFAGLLAVSVLAALARVWLPIVYDGLGFIGWSGTPPQWLQTEGLGAWVKIFAFGLASFALLTGLACLAGLVPLSPAGWLPAFAAKEFLGYFMIAVTLIVVAVPKGLAMSVTLSLAYSMRKITASNTRTPGGPVAHGGASGRVA